MEQPPSIPADFTEGLSVFHSEAENEITGQFSGKSTRGAQDLKAFFEGEASSLGLTTSSSNSVNLGGTETITLVFSGGGKSLNIVITEKPGSSTLMKTNYSETK